VGLPASSRFALTPDLNICRVLNGMWQVSGAHGRIDREAAVQAMFTYHDAGFTTWDLADHYGPAEDFLGEFRRRMLADRGEAALKEIQAFTKWVPQPGPISRIAVRSAIERSLHRMAVQKLDLLQFHWWEYEDPSYLDALSHLDELRKEGLIRHLALTNFDTHRMRLILERGITIVSNQVQYSLVDRRPEREMVELCQEKHVQLLTYGTLAGGLLSERYLGQSEPGRFELDTASLQKYKRMVDTWGGWSLFQELLRTLGQVAERRGSSIQNVAVRYILDKPAVAGVIVGVRLGVSDHHEETARIFDLIIEESDCEQIDGVLAKGRDLFRLIGDCGAEYRR
jgi:aryl-alcohol dehydrogenase-like predicted oxidoreductase